MPSKTNLKLNSSPSKEKDRTRRISGISARTAFTTNTNYTATTTHTGTSFAASSTFSSFVSTKSSSGFGSRIKRLLGVTVKDLNVLPPMPSMPPSPTATTFASNYTNARTPAPSLRRTHVSMPSIDKDHLSPVRSALSNLPSFKEKKRLVIRLIANPDDTCGMGRLSASQEERAFECIKEWCSIYGALKRISRKSPFVPYQSMQVVLHSQEKYAMEVHVHFKTRNIAERVSVLNPCLFSSAPVSLTTASLSTRTSASSLRKCSEARSDPFNCRAERHQDVIQSNLS
ncbi:hypothetical protein SCHPADRAFT_72859 [Schizopora paradoxa]|uniref:Uncharacterized protein n=1 Tax=Schizopora paradoxa TaxID=27342 RepID=A0A0H2SC89_9AGAM|nr:hypothetical protein SCHPADRAFT_72859 [Schizopora paradoxa]